MHVVFDGLSHSLLGRLEQRTDIDIETDIGKRRRNDFRASVVPVLPEFDDEQARPAAFCSAKDSTRCLDFGMKSSSPS